LKCLNDELSENELKDYVQTPLQSKGIEL